LLVRISRSRAALELALEGAGSAGARATLIDLRELDLPMWNADADEPTAAAERLIESCHCPDGMRWSSPMYQARRNA
jgi:azobenzene reductase